MIFGMPTLIEQPDIKSSAALCRELGFDFVELNMNLPQYTAEKLEKIDFGSLMREYGVFFTLHLDENFRPCDFDADVANAYLRSAARAIAVAVKYGFPVLNMHLDGGVYFSLPDGKAYLFERYKEEYFVALSQFRGVCEDAIGDANVKICIENTNGYRDHQKTAIDFLLESKVFALTLDVGHSQAVNGADMPFIASHIDRLFHMHVHEYACGSAHMPLGGGSSDTNKNLAVAEEHGCRCVIEVKTSDALRESAAWLRSRGYIK